MVRLVPGAVMFDGRYTQVRDEKIIGEAPSQKPYSRWRIYKYSNISLHENIHSVLAMVIADLERPVVPGL